MFDPTLDIGDTMACVALIPGAIKLFGGGAQLDDQIAGQVFCADLAPFLAPQSNESCLIRSHDDTSIRAADEGPPFRELFRIVHDWLLVMSSLL